MEPLNLKNPSGYYIVEASKKILVLDMIELKFGGATRGPNNHS